VPIDKIFHPAVLVAAALYFGLGRLWYGPLFGAKWAAAVHVANPGANVSDPVPMLVAAAMSVVIAYVVAMLLHLVQGAERTVVSGVSFGLFAGVGMVASAMLASGLQEGRPTVLWLIDAGYTVTGCMLIGAVVGGWKRSHVL